MRYLLNNHPAFPGLLSKEDLYLLIERGSVARGDICTDVATGRDHRIGDIVSTMRPPRPSAPTAVDRPAYRELRADTPLLDDPTLVEEAEEPIDDDESQFTSAGEVILYQDTPSWFAYSKPLFLAVLLAIASGMLFMFEGNYFLITLAASILVMTAVAIARASREYLVTEDRVEVVWGILGRSSKEVRICDIRSIDVREAGLKGLLGFGTLDFTSVASAGTEVQFRDIRRAHEVKHLVRQLQKQMDNG